MEKEKKTWLVVGKKEWQIFLFHLRHNQKGRINIKLQNSCSDSLWFHIKKQNTHLCCSFTKLCLTSQAHRLQHARFFCTLLSLGVCPNPCPLSRWCSLTISSSALPSTLPLIFPSIRVFSNELALHIRWPLY